MVIREFLGVYSQKQHTNEVKYHLIWRQDNMYSVQKLDANLHPVDILTTIDEHSFKTYFVHEPNFEKIPSSEKVKVRKHVKKEEKQENNAQLREKSLRELFHLSATRLQKHALRESALKEIKELLDIKEGIIPEHKHMFADFGKQMRKEREFELALQCCERVLLLAPHDDHAHYNMARILLEMQRYDQALHHVRITLKIDPSNTVYLQTWEYLQNMLDTKKTKNK